ncbi:MAG: STM4504/CBY_0614 family protein [Acidaminococcaceae bacterium]
MSIFETFSKRLKKKKKEGIKDFYQYDKLPQELRVQIIYIWKDAAGENNLNFWDFLNDTLAKELGRFSLIEDARHNNSNFYNCGEFLLKAETNEALDIIELSFKMLDSIARKYNPIYRQNYCITQSADDAIDDLNYRFKEHGVGYQFVNSQLIRIDSEYIHNEIVKNAIQLLRDESFDGATEEFSKAHEYYRKGKSKESIAESLKAFESTLKSICERKKWNFNAEKDTSSKLIDIVFSNELIPKYLQQQFSSMKSCLESGVPTVRNKTSGHGQGQSITEVPAYFAAYALHLTAVNIVFLVDAFTDSNKRKR